MRSFSFETLSQTLSDLCGVGLCEINAQGCISRISDAGAALLGVDAQAAIGQVPATLARGAVRIVPARDGWLLLVREPWLVQEELDVKNAALEASTNAIVLTDARGVIEYVNPQFSRMTGYSLAEAVGQHTRILKSGKQPEAFYATLWATITSGVAWHGTFVNNRKDGTAYIEDCTITPVETAGHITHFIAVKHDLTSEQRLRALAERGARVDLLGQVAASVAHDLANLLTPLVMGAAFIEDGGGDAAETRAAVHDIAESARKAVAMSRWLLDFARGGQGTKLPVDTTQLLTAHAQHLARLLPSNVNFVRDLAPGLPTLMLDPMQLLQVLLNLGVNAVHSMPHGGTLRLGARAVPAGTADSRVELAVSDTGTGIAPEVLPFIFEPFFTTRAPGEGTGLGLSTVKRVVDAHGGAIRIDSEPGRGTTFTISFPVGR